MEKYLTSIQNILIRQTISKIRLSNHDLMIEKGRHKKLELQMRTCPFCSNLIETEIHFLLECTTFSIFRKNLKKEAREKIPGFDTQSEENMFKILLCDERIQHETGKYLEAALNLRKTLTENL